MAEPYERALAEALASLRTAQALLARQIAAYPSPISGCDAQFTRLLSDRARLSEAMAALEVQPFVPTSRWPEPHRAA